MGEKAQTWARAQLRGCALGVLGFLLFFFIIGVVASNDFESDPYSPVSAGGLAKVVLIPICIVLGVAFVKVALPMFGGGKRAAASKKYQDLARQRISDNRYRSGNAIAISNALIVIGVIVVTASFAREDPQQGVLGAIICVAALRYAGRLRSERAAAQHLGARTLTDDVKDSVSNFAAASAAVSVGIASLTAEGARKIAARFKAALQNDAKLGVEGLKMDNDDQKQPGEILVTPETLHHTSKPSDHRVQSRRRHQDLARLLLVARQFLILMFCHQTEMHWLQEA